jgi:hypothetical protein
MLVTRCGAAPMVEARRFLRQEISEARRFLMSDSLLDRSKIMVEPQTDESAKEGTAGYRLDRFFRPILGFIRSMADGVEPIRPLEDDIRTISAQARRLSKSMQDYGSELRGYGAWAKKF